MPMYEFVCPECKAAVTKLCKLGERGETLVCALCGHTGLNKKISAFSTPGGSGGKTCTPGCGGDCAGCH